MTATRTHVLHVTYRQSGAYLNVTARVMAWQDESIRNIRVYDSYSPDPFGGIVATGQTDNESHDGDSTWPDSYAWALGFRGDAFETIPAAQLTVSLATIRKAERAMQSAADKYGPAATFGAFVVRVAAALRLDIVTGAVPSGWYSDGDYRTLRPSDAVASIDGAIRDHRAGRTVTA